MSSSECCSHLLLNEPFKSVWILLWTVWCTVHPMFPCLSNAGPWMADNLKALWKYWQLLLATVYNVHFYLGQNEHIYERSSNFWWGLWFLHSFYNDLLSFISLPYLSHHHSIVKEGEKWASVLLFIYINSTAVYCFGVIGRSKPIWLKRNDYKLQQDSFGWRRRWRREIGCYINLKTSYKAKLFLKCCTEFKTLEFWVRRKWPLKEYSCEHCLDWQRQINELFCEEIRH